MTITIPEEADSLLWGGIVWADPPHLDAIRSVAVWPDSSQKKIAEKILAAHEAGELGGTEHDRVFALNRRLSETDLSAMARIASAAVSCDPWYRAESINTWARQAAYEKRRAEAVDVLPRLDPRDAREYLGAFLDDLETAPSKKFSTLYDWQTLAAQEIPFVFRDAIPAGYASVLASRGGVGKSMLALGLALSVVTGRALFPSFTPTGRGAALIISSEDSEHVIARRIAAYQRLSDTDPMYLHECIAQRLFVRASGVSAFLDGGAETEFFLDALTWARETRPRLIVLDHLRRLCGAADENANAEIGAFMAACNRLAAESGAAVVVLHHIAKSSADDPDLNAPRGGGAATDEARAVWVLRATPGGAVAENVKQSYGPLRPPVQLTFAEGAFRETVSTMPEEIILAWFRAHPLAEVTEGGILRGPGAGKDLAAAVTAHFPKLDRAAVGGTVAGLLRDGRLVSRETQRANRTPITVLGLPPEGCQNEN